jgi:glycosyltransferase involved in cell wall biosynthesis
MLDRVRLFSSFARHKLNPTRQRELYYVTPGTNWVLDWVGHYIAEGVKERHKLKAHVVQSARAVFGELVHYGSLWESVEAPRFQNYRYNANVGTIFHGIMNDPVFHDSISRMVDNQTGFAKLHTASTIMEKRLLEWGVEAEKLEQISLGVDLNRFHPVSDEERKMRRQELGIPENAFCIGSFHKDGIGRAEGNEPKLIKGPDIFLKVIDRLRKSYPLFILLSAPARGYMIRGLEALGVSYKHVNLTEFHEIPRLYHALDLYLLASREEGGPQSVLESLASGVAFVGTRVGLAPDVIQDGENGALVDIENVEGLANAVAALVDNPKKRDEIRRKGLEAAQKYDWGKIADQYYLRLYEPHLIQAAS